MAPVAEALRRGGFRLWVARIAGHETSVAGAGADVVARLVRVGRRRGPTRSLRVDAADRGRSGSRWARMLTRPARGRAPRRGRRGRVALAGDRARAVVAPPARRAVSDARGRSTRTCRRCSGWLAPLVMTKGGSDIADLEVRRRHPGYRQVPLRALLNLLHLQRLAWNEAPALTQPALVMHATNDHTCPLDGARALFDRLGSARQADGRARALLPRRHRRLRARAGAARELDDVPRRAWRRGRVVNLRPTTRRLTGRGGSPKPVACHPRRQRDDGTPRSSPSTAPTSGTRSRRCRSGSRPIRW